VLIVGVVGVVAIGGVVLARGRSHQAAGHRAAATGASPASTHRSVNSPGSVFLEHLPKCTRTDHHHVLTVAFGVTNLGPKSLLLLAAAPLTSDDGVLRLTRVRLGVDACGAGGGKNPIELAPTGEAVAAMTFHVNAECPHRTIVAARVTFEAGGGGIVHSDSSGLANLSELTFAQC
jgi:hypothetical protein